MPRHPELYEWAGRVATHFPDLPRAVAFGLAAWSFGMVLAHAAGLSAVACALAPVLGRSANTARQRLREFYQPADRKRGRNRVGFDPADCCGPLVRWVTAGWADKRVAVALDATNLGDRFHVLTAAVVYRGCAVPVAWDGPPGRPGGPVEPALGPAPGPGRGRLRAGLGRGRPDRPRAGVGRPVRAIVGRGFHPPMRVKAAGSFRPAGWHKHRPMAAFAGRPGARFAAAGSAYRTAPLACTLLAGRAAGCADAWLVLTDLPPAAADPCWYALRSWVEQGFKVLKSGGWQWHRTRMTDPDRAGRMWVALAVATVWMVEVGGLAEGEPRAETIPPFRPAAGPRLHRLFRVGRALILAGLLAGRVTTGRLVPEPWPAQVPIPPVSEEEFIKQLTYP